MSGGRGRRRRLPAVATWTLGLAAVATVGVVAGIAVGASRRSTPSPAAACPVAAGWLQLQGDAAHTGVAPGAPAPAFLHVRWRRDVGGVGGVVVAGRDVVVGSGGGVVDLAASDGSERWRWRAPAAGDRVAGPPAVAGCRVGIAVATGEGGEGQVQGQVRLVGTDSHGLVRAEAADALSAGGLLAAGGRFTAVTGSQVGGGVRWQVRDTVAAGGPGRVVDAGGFAPGPPAQVGPLTVAATWAQTLVALDDAGAVRWTVPLGALPLTAPVAAQGVVLEGTATGVEAVDASGGGQRWVAAVTAGVAAPPVVVSGVAVVVARDGTVSGLDISDGRRLWLASVPRTTAPAVGVGDSVLVAADDGTLSVVGTDGAVRLSTRLPVGVERPMAVAGRRLYALGTDGTVLAVDLG